MHSVYHNLNGFSTRWREEKVLLTGHSWHYLRRSETWDNRVNYVVQAPFGNGIGTTGSAAAKNSGLAGTSGNSLGSLLQGYAGADTSDDALGSVSYTHLTLPTKRIV